MVFSTEKKIEIVCEQMKFNLSHKQVFEKHGVKKSTLYYWRLKFFPNSVEDKYEDRKLLESIKAEVTLTGMNKEYFLKDSFTRSWNYARLLRNIVELHYSIMSNRPDMEGKEMGDIKRMINEKVKL